jgi:hypothetical protein
LSPSRAGQFRKLLQHARAGGEGPVLFHLVQGGRSAARFRSRRGGARQPGKGFLCPRAGRDGAIVQGIGGAEYLAGTRRDVQGQGCGTHREQIPCAFRFHISLSRCGGDSFTASFQRLIAAPLANTPRGAVALGDGVCAERFVGSSARVAARGLTVSVGAGTPTSSTAFALPNGFGMSSLASGSSTHWPSTTKRYS